MGKKKAKQMGQAPKQGPIPTYARKMTRDDAEVFEKTRRDYRCLHDRIKGRVLLDYLESKEIRHQLAYACRNIEQQFIKLRQLVCLTTADLDQRRFIAQQILDCLYRHHRVIYEGLIFGSSINGLGFRDSDVDMRLRTLLEAADGMLQPIDCERPIVERTLKNIAYQTTRCNPASGYFAPSNRCPVAKIKLVSKTPIMREGLNLDITMLSSNSLGSFNSKYIRFLCHIEPRFHLLATVVRYWSKAHDLIQAGRLSSYALTTMLIFFCQNTSPPLLPTVDQMGEAYFRDVAPSRGESDAASCRNAMLRQEWNCLISFNSDSYCPSENSEPLCLLLLRFFEFYLKFPYTSDTIISTRTGEHINYESFKKSPIFDRKFALKKFLNIQDPFDLKHNVTAGMEHNNFKLLIEAMRVSYERLFSEVGKFTQPPELRGLRDGEIENTAPQDKPKGSLLTLLEDWGLNAIFVKVNKRNLAASKAPVQTPKPVAQPT